MSRENCTHHWTVTSPCAFCQSDEIAMLRTRLAQSDAMYSRCAYDYMTLREAAAVDELTAASLIRQRDAAWMAKKEADARCALLESALRDVADFKLWGEVGEWCWCGDADLPSTHQPYCIAARAALGGGR